MKRITRRAKRNLAVGAVFVLAVTLVTGYIASVASAQPLPQGVVILGQDSDNPDNPVIQPPGVTANQSLDNTDILIGTEGDDVIIGLLGSDLLDGRGGNDILIGGTEQGTLPNSDIILGGDGDDISIWAGGDGSELFLGGPGRDILVFAVIDRDETNVPTLTPSVLRPATGVPTANLSGGPGFCEVEALTDSNLGYSHLIRFRIRATGALAVTLRTLDVEAVFCGGPVAGQIAFADLTQPDARFIEANLDQVRTFSAVLGEIVR